MVQKMKKLLVLFGLFAAGSVAAQEIVLRHALDGRALDTLATLVVRFNDEQKGKAKVVIEDANGVADKQKLPHLALLDADDGLDFFGTRPRFKPLYELMRESGEKFDATRFYPQIADAVDDLNGRILALPVGLSLPVLYLNREALLKAKLDPEHPPQTWWEVQKFAGDLFDAGYKCPLTSSRFPWVHIENVASQHGEPLVTKSGKSEKLAVNSMVNVKHIALLSSWYKSFYFHWFGPAREADQKFASGQCAMLTGESSSLASLRREAKFTVVMADLPHYDDVYGVKPADVLPDGMALWALPGKKKEENRVAARFVSFLMRADVQRDWVRATSFLPMTAVAVEALRSAGVSPSLLARAEKRLGMPRQGQRTRPDGSRSRIREILSEEISFVWKDTKPAKEALDTAVTRAAAVFAPAAVAAPARKIH
jgi:sn-glycerol 3-phosphate transport system substrate-binding protein